MFYFDIILFNIFSCLTNIPLVSFGLFFFTYFIFCRNFDCFLFRRLLAPTLTLCMVCESACLLVYVTKMYLHNRRRTLEDFKTKNKNTNLPQQRRLPRAPNRMSFFFLVGVTIQDFSRDIWYCSCCFRWWFWRHLEHVRTVLKRNTLCQTSATSTPSKRLPKNVPLSQICECAVTGKKHLEKKGHRRFWLSLPPRPVLSI